MLKKQADVPRNGTSSRLSAADRVERPFLDIPSNFCNRNNLLDIAPAFFTAATRRSIYEMPMVPLSTGARQT
jgi:hypothetical protein